MQFFFATAGIASLVSGILYYFQKRNFLSIATSIGAPVLVLLVYIMSGRDEFGNWAVTFSLALCYCVIGSIFGIFIVAKFFKKLF